VGKQPERPAEPGGELAEVDLAGGEVADPADHPARGCVIWTKSIAWRSPVLSRPQIVSRLWRSQARIAERPGCTRSLQDSRMLRRMLWQLREDSEENRKRAASV
jgi:hypothetical protein